MLFTVPNRNIINRHYMNLIFGLRVDHIVDSYDINETLKASSLLHRTRGIARRINCDGKPSKRVNNLQVEEAQQWPNCTRLIYLLSHCYLWDISFHVLIIHQASCWFYFPKNSARAATTKKSKRHDGGKVDRNVLECDNLTSCSVFIYCPYSDESFSLRRRRKRREMCVLE